MITQLIPPLEIDTPKGRAWVHFVIDYAPNYDLYWVAFLRESGECWTFRNQEIKLAKCETMGVRHTGDLDWDVLRPTAPVASPFQPKSITGRKRKKSRR